MLRLFRIGACVLLPIAMTQGAKEPDAAAQIAALALRAQFSHLPAATDDSAIISFEGRAIPIGSLAVELARLEKPVRCETVLSLDLPAIRCTRVAGPLVPPLQEGAPQFPNSEALRIDVRIMDLIETTIAVPLSALDAYLRNYVILGSVVWGPRDADDPWQPHDHVVGLCILLPPQDVIVREP